MNIRSDDVSSEKSNLKGIAPAVNGHGCFRFHKVMMPVASDIHSISPPYSDRGTQALVCQFE